ncbi:MAG: T9SS type A sorting domain-containing protein [Bacteroidia bacterium]|nr:T9SS type A sorting domain-containing protein [Bacteroidia bacterium]
MKKLYIIAVVLLMGGAMFAQTQNIPMNPRTKLHRPINNVVKPSHLNGPEAISSFIVDYDTADAYTWWTGGDTYDRFIWDMNWNYNAAQGDTALKYVVTAFDTIIDSYANPSPVGYPLNSVQQVKVDSIYFIIGQENNSTTDDTLIVKLMNVNANGYPSTTVYWSDTLYFPQDIPHGTNWLQAYYVSIPVNGSNGFVIPSNGKKYSVRLEYHGNKQDTCGVLAGFGSFQGSCGSSPNALLAYQTQTGAFKVNSTTWYNANSFAVWTEYATYGTLPTTSGANLYYDCDGSGGITSGDGMNYIQNLNILTYETVTTNVGMTEDFVNGIRLGQNYPNPSVADFNLIYQIEKSSAVKLEIMDMTGKVVAVFNEGNKAAGQHTIKISDLNLQSGTYFYTLTANGNKLTKKFSIAK